MNEKELDIDEEIGLTDDEIKEITSNDGLEVLSSEKSKDSNQDVVLDDLSFDSKTNKESDDQIDNLMEEIDLSDLDKEIEDIDVENNSLEEKTSTELHQDKDLEIDDIGLGVNDALTTSEKTKTTSSPKNEKVPLSTKTKPIKKSPVHKKSTPSKSKSTYRSRKKKPTTPKMSTTSRGKGINDNPEQMRKLFLRLDEMLSKLPPDQIKQFALSKEYEYYFTILKKLGI